jgi:hypothetical protein
MRLDIVLAPQLRKTFSTAPSRVGIEGLIRRIAVIQELISFLYFVISRK